MLSFIIPAHNEEMLLGGTIRAIQDAGSELDEPFEIIVVDDASSDETTSIAEQAGAVGGGTAVQFDEPTPRYGRILLSVLLWLNCRLQLASGCFIFCTRDAFLAVGGFDSTLFAGDEVAISRALAKQGRFTILREAVTTSGRKLRSYSARELLGTLAKLALLGRRGLRDRTRLALWYGPRPPDPGAATQQRKRTLS